MSPDGSYVYDSGGGCPTVINASTDSLTNAIPVCNIGDQNEDMAISEDGSVLLTADLLTDQNLNIENDISYVDRDVWLPKAVYGQKLNSDGSLVFTPLTNAIDVHDGITGLLSYRIALSIQIANVYDALAIDNKDSLLFAITSTGIAALNISALPNSSSAETPRSRTVIRKNAVAYAAVQHKNAQGFHLDRPHLTHPGDLRFGRVKHLPDE